MNAAPRGPPYGSPILSCPLTALRRHPVAGVRDAALDQVTAYE
ncbi:hypothetical protein ACIPC1_22995 [Streptomyces sp. NPDC087263]